jgi:transposase InsO family protein
MNDTQREQVALFRFSVIGSLISGELAHGELKSRIRQLSSRRYAIPFSPKTSIGFGTIEEWLHNYRKNSLAGLTPAVRTDKGTVRTLRPELKNAIITLKKEHPKRSVRSILDHLVTNNLMKPNEISKTTTYRMLGLALPKHPPSVTGNEQKRFVHQYPNQCWQGDVMHGPYLKESGNGKARKTYLIAFIDDASRLIVGAQFFFAETTANIKTVLRSAVLTYGVPAKLYLDNGRNFCADDIRIACAKMNTALIHTTPYYPKFRIILRRSGWLEYNPSAQRIIIPKAREKSNDGSEPFGRAFCRGSKPSNLSAISTSHLTPGSSRNITADLTVHWKTLLPLKPFCEALREKCEGCPTISTTPSCSVKKKPVSSPPTAPSESITCSTMLKNN